MREPLISDLVSVLLWPQLRAIFQRLDHPNQRLLENVSSHLPFCYQCIFPNLSLLLIFYMSLRMTIDD
jgi:hypothetical protein